MSVSALRNSLCWMMIVLCPLWLLAADTGGAVVHTKGGVWVNGAEAADSTAVFSGDLLETKPGSLASLDAEGSSVLIQPESVVKFQGSFLSLEHGSVSVETSTSMSVRVNCINVEPASKQRTQYDVADLGGMVHVAVHKDNVNITEVGALRKAAQENNASQSAIVHEGQEATRNEAACGAIPRPAGAGNGLNTKWLEIGGAAGGGIIVLCLLLCKGSTPTSVSPSQP
jgi:hypothetical protein